MIDSHTQNGMPSVFSPLAKALLDGFAEGVVVFDAEGKVLYANTQARGTLSEEDLSGSARDLLRQRAPGLRVGVQHLPLGVEHHDALGEAFEQGLGKRRED